MWLSNHFRSYSSSSWSVATYDSVEHQPHKGRQGSGSVISVCFNSHSGVHPQLLCFSALAISFHALFGFPYDVHDFVGWAIRFGSAECGRQGRGVGHLHDTWLRQPVWEKVRMFYSFVFTLLLVCTQLFEWNCTHVLVACQCVLLMYLREQEPVVQSDWFCSACTSVFQS